MPDTPAKTRIEAIDLIKGLAIIAVVLGHVLVDKGFLNAWVSSFQVPLFFFAAGLGFSVKRPPSQDADGTKRASLFGSGKTFGAFVAKKLRQLMLPYALFGVVAIIIYLVMGTLAASILGRGEADLSALDCLYGLIYGTAALPQLFVYRPLWFLPCLFVMEVLAAALVWVLPESLPPRPKAGLVFSISIVLAALGLIYKAKVGTPLLWGIETACTLLPFFAGGYCLRSLVPPARLEELLASTARRRIFTALAGVALLGAGIFFAHVNYTQSGLQSVAYVVNDYRITWAFYTSAALQCLALTAIAFAWKRCRPLAYLGRHTLWILGVHKYPILAFQILPLTGALLADNNIALALAVVAVAILFSLAVEVLAKKALAAFRSRKR